MKKPYTDDNGVLRNKFGISNAALLVDVEYGLTTQRLYWLQEHPIKGDFDLAHLQGLSTKPLSVTFMSGLDDNAP